MRPNPAKPPLLMIFGGFVILPILLMIFVAPTLAGQQQAQTPIVSIAGSMGGVALCVFMCLTKMPLRGPLPPIREFQVNMLNALAGAELVVLLGLFVGSKEIGPWPFFGVNLALQLLLILPRVLRFVRESPSDGDSGRKL